MRKTALEDNCTVIHCLQMVDTSYSWDETQVFQKSRYRFQKPYIQLQMTCEAGSCSCIHVAYSRYVSCHMTNQLLVTPFHANLKQSEMVQSDISQLQLLNYLLCWRILCICRQFQGRLLSMFAEINAARFPDNPSMLT